MGSMFAPALVITEATIREDAERFSQLHSWNKHLDHPGSVFIIHFERGQEPRNGIHPSVTDTTGLHMHLADMALSFPFTDTLPAVCRKYPVVLTKQLEGCRSRPEHDAEKARQLMLADICKKATAIARELNVLATPPMETWHVLIQA